MANEWLVNPSWPELMAIWPAFVPRSMAGKKRERNEPVRRRKPQRSAKHPLGAGQSWLYAVARWSFWPGHNWLVTSWVCVCVMARMVWAKLVNFATHSQSSSLVLEWAPRCHFWVNSAAGSHLTPTILNPDPWICNEIFRNELPKQRTTQLIESPTGLLCPQF